jgi:hypothetical protein
MQRFLFRGTRFGYYMPSDALNFEDYDEEFLEGNVGFYSDENGQMSDGSSGWEYI